MRDRFPLVVAAGLVVLAVAGGYLVRSAARGEFADVLSTWRSEPDGARGLYLLAQESGLRVGRHQSDLEVIPEDAQWVLLGVAQRKNSNSNPSLDDNERTRLFDHVKRGNTLIYVANGELDDPVLSPLGVSLVEAEGIPGMRNFLPAQPSLWTRGVERAEAEVDRLIGLPENGVPLLVDSKTGATVAGYVPWGLGKVVVVSARELAMNKRLTLADNARLWLSLLRASGARGPVYFDEFHHGFTDDRSMAAFAARYGLHFAILQLLLGLALWAFALRRFGRPQLPPESERVGSTDALFAASRIYREGRHHGFAASLLARGLARELAEHAGLPPRAQPKEVAAALRARNEPTLAEGLESVAARAQLADSERAVEDVARKAAELRRQLFELRTTS